MRARFAARSAAIDIGEIDREARARANARTIATTAGYRHPAVMAGAEGSPIPARLLERSARFAAIDTGDIDRDARVHANVRDEVPEKTKCKKHQ